MKQSREFESIIIVKDQEGGKQRTALKNRKNWSKVDDQKSTKGDKISEKEESSLDIRVKQRLSLSNQKSEAKQRI